MNKILTFSVFFLIITNAVGQTDEQLIIDKVFNADTLTEIETTIGKYRFELAHWDLLNDNLVQSNYKLFKKNKAQSIGLLTLSKKGIIIYSEVYKWTINDDYDGWDSHVLKSRSVKDTKIPNLDHLSRLPYRSTFGYACGAGGSLPSEGLEMLKLVQSNNLDELTGWLNSINPVYQAYAFVGFSILSKRGTTLGPEITDKLNQIKANQMSIHYCSGCTVIGHYPLSEMLDDELKYFLRRVEN